MHDSRTWRQRTGVKTLSPPPPPPPTLLINIMVADDLVMQGAIT